MPRYDFQCSACARIFEALLKYSDVDVHTPRCPHCESSQTKRLFKPSSLVIKRANRSYRLNSEDFQQAVGLANSASSSHDQQAQPHKHADHHHEQD